MRRKFCRIPGKDPQSRAVLSRRVGSPWCGASTRHRIRIFKPMRTRTLLAATSAVVTAFFASPVLADDPAGGFSLSGLPYPGLSLTATLSDGDILTFDGTTVDRYDESGAYEATLATFNPAVWSSFLVVDPTEATALIAESTNGGVYRVDLSGAGATFLANMLNNYDATFEDAGHALVSAATCGWGCGNEVHRLDLVTGATTLVATVPGASGPVALAANGDLYYGTVSDAFPPPPGASSVLRWSAAQLTGAPVVTELDAAVIGTGYEAAGSLVIDPVDGRVYMAENDFASGSNRVRRVTASAATAPILVEGSPGRWITNFEFVAGDAVALFRAYQPDTGGRLRFNTTDWFSAWERNELAPLRPSLLTSGPGTIGAGNVDLDLVAAAPLGMAFVLYGPSGLFDSNELAVYLAAQDLNLFVGLDLSTLAIHPVPMFTDAQGEASMSFLHDGTLLGTLAMQAFVLDAGGRVAAISHAAFL